MFKDYCENKDIMWMLNPPVYRKILPKNTFKVYCEIRDAIALGEKIYVHPDPDID